MKKLKSGYTTGSTAAAAAKIAVYTLFNGTRVDTINIDTPKGIELTINANYLEIEPNRVKTFVIKDFSDDPDVTRGIKIYAEAREISDPEIVIKTGEGIGIVTKKGLRVPIGEPAINPVPKMMIINEISKVLPEDRGVEVTLTIPEGLEISKKTFNEKLGIIGGLSILGTTGIVEPMSEGAYKESLKLEMGVKLLDTGAKSMILLFGNYGSDYLKEYNIGEDYYQKCSNFIGYMVRAASELGVEKLLLVGHAGKMVKVAFGMENTHSKYGDNRMLSLSKSCLDFNKDEIARVLECNTTDEAVEYLKEKKCSDKVFNHIAQRCKDSMEEWGDNSLIAETIIFTSEYGTVGSTQDAFNILRELGK